MCKSWERTASMITATTFLSRAVSRKGAPPPKLAHMGSGKENDRLASNPSFENLELIGESVKGEQGQPQSEKSKNPDVERIEFFNDTEFRQIHCMQPWKGNMVVVAGLIVPFDGFLEVWNVAERVMVKRLMGDLFGDSCMAIRGNTLVCSGARGTLKVFDLEAGEKKMTLRGHDMPVNAVLALGGGQWVTGSDDGTMRSWDTKAACCKAVIQANHPVTCLAANCQETVLVSGSDQKQMQVWCAKKLVCFYTLEIPDGVLSMASGNNTLFIGSQKGLQLWDFTRDVPSISRKVDNAEMEHVTHVSVKGRNVVTASTESVKVWDVDKSRRIRKVTFMGGVSGALLCGKVLMVGTTLGDKPLMFCDLV